MASKENHDVICFCLSVNRRVTYIRRVSLKAHHIKNTCDFSNSISMMRFIICEHRFAQILLQHIKKEKEKEKRNEIQIKAQHYDFTFFFPELNIIMIENCHYVNEMKRTEEHRSYHLSVLHLVEESKDSA